MANVRLFFFFFLLLFFLMKLAKNIRVLNIIILTSKVQFSNSRRNMFQNERNI